jgi:hypothetical protein
VLRARGERCVLPSNGLAMVPGGAVTPEQLQGLAECKPTPAVVLSDPGLDCEPLCVRLVLQSLCALTAQLLKCLVMQQGVSSFLFSRVDRVVG